MSVIVSHIAVTQQAHLIWIVQGVTGHTEVMLKLDLNLIQNHFKRWFESLLEEFTNPDKLEIRFRAAA